MPEETRRASAAALKLGLAGLIAVADQVTKTLILAYLHSGESYPVPGAWGLVHLTLVRNTGTAFGLFAGSNLFFIVVSIIIIACLVFLLLKGWGWHDIPLVLILGGAIGNLIDRLRWGYVVDFIDLRVWPVFNLADSCISVGIAWLLWRTLRLRIKGGGGL